MADAARIPEIVLPPDDPHVAKALVAATSKRGRPAVAIVFAESNCRVCGEPATRDNSLCAAHAGVELDAQANRAMVKAFLERKAFRAAELVSHAAEIAAAKGDSKPAEFILLHSKTVDPVKAQQDAGGGIVINVGVVLPGCGS